MAIYETIRLRGLQGEELVVHMCRQGNDDAIEFLVPGGPPVVISQEQFKGIFQWAAQQFEELGKIKRFVN